MNVLTTWPLTFPQYCQTPSCLLVSLGSADQCVIATCAPPGNALPSLAVHGSAMNLSVSFSPLNRTPTPLPAVSCLPSLAAVCSSQRRLYPSSRLCPSFS